MRYILFTTTTCPKCPPLKAFVNENVALTGETLDNTSPDFAERAKEFGVEAAPTLIFLDAAEREVFRGGEVSEVQEFLAKRS